MSPEKAKPFSIGETQPTHHPDGSIGVSTLIEIIELPEDQQEREQIINSVLVERPLTKPNISIISGLNLADDPALAPRINQNALYIFED